MEKDKLNSLVEELNALSEFEEQNKQRMLEIAHVLIMHYQGKSE